MSVLGSGRIGSSLSLRGYSRFGSALALFGGGRVGSSLSVLDFLHLGSSLSLRSFSRLGASLSVLDFGHFGSSLSVRGVLHCGSSISVNDRIDFAANTYIHYTAGSPGPAAIEHYVSNTRTLGVMKTGSTGIGILHGLWYADMLVTQSDRRLKSNIRPLVDSFSNRRKLAGATQEPEGADASQERGGASSFQGGSDDDASWVLRQLRPVSYQFNVGSDAKGEKGMRFGFIADEVSKTIPEVLRTSPGKTHGLDNMQGIMYQDLIAVLVAGMQALNTRMQRFEQRQGMENQILDRLKVLEAEVKEVKQRQGMEARIMDRLKGIEDAMLLQISAPAPAPASLRSSPWSQQV